VGFLRHEFGLEFESLDERAADALAILAGVLPAQRPRLRPAA
jgi:hypothetical protein